MYGQQRGGRATPLGGELAAAFAGIVANAEQTSQQVAVGAGQRIQGARRTASVAEDRLPERLEKFAKGLWFGDAGA